MGAKKNLVVIDTNVFVIDLRYKRDQKFKINYRFLNHISAKGGGLTTIYNLLEICGILSFNLNVQQLNEFFNYFPDHYNVTVLPTSNLESSLPNISIEKLFDYICKKTSLGDALILATIKNLLPKAELLVSWDKEHLEGKGDLKVLTPKEYLDM